MIEDILIEGNKRVEENTIKTYLELHIGSEYRADKAEKSLKNLFKTGLFEDVTIEQKGAKIYVFVKENPIINRIMFEGNKRLKDDVLKREIISRPRVVYTRARVQQDVQRLLTLYRRSGRFAASIIPKLIERDQNRVDLIFEIKEGAPTKIQKINFIGNRVFSESQLQSVLSSKEDRWYRFLSTADRYDPDRMNYDKELLRQFYLSKGYADFKVLSAIAELTSDEKYFILTFSIEEGERYKVGQVTIETQLKDVDLESLYEEVTFEKGDWYNADEVRKSVEALKENLNNLHYAFIEVDPDANKHKDERVIDIIFRLKEGPKSFIEQINISGNVRTIDKVIRRELTFVEGDAYSRSRIKNSQRNLSYLDFFSKAEIKEERGSEPDLVKMNVEVEEKSTGEISLGAGYGTSEGIFGDLQFRERNLVGTGKDLALGTRLGGKARRLDLSLTEPYFMDRNLSAGGRIFLVEHKKHDSIIYNTKSYGGSLSVGYYLGDNLRQTLTYGLNHKEVFGVNSTEPRLFRREEGKFVTSEISQFTIYDTRDSRLDPTEGYFMSLATDLAGLGGDVYYIQNIIEGGYVYTLFPKWIAGVRASYANITGLAGKRVGLSDRFNLGGNNLRGFEDGGVGPREVNLSPKDALGGTNRITGTLGLSFPLGLPDEIAIKGHIYTDIGMLWDPDVKAIAGEKIEDDKFMRASVGAGISYLSPIGPLRVDYAIPVRKKSYDRTENFRISVGTRF